MRLGAQFKTQNSKFLTRTADAVRHALFHRFVKKNEPVQPIFIFYLYFCHVIQSFAILFMQR